MKNKKVVPLLILIVLAALFLRVHNLSSRGLQFTDEGRYYSGPAKVAVHIKWLVSNERLRLPSEQQHEMLIESITQFGGMKRFVSMSKPLYGLITIIVFLIFGVSTYNLLLINAMLGVATVLIIYLLARRLDLSPAASLMAALALAFSGFHLIWSRGAFAQGMSTFFLTCGLACYAQGAWVSSQRMKSWFFASGALLGLSVSTHLVSVPYIGICFLTELYRGARRRNTYQAFKNSALLMIGLTTTVLIISAATWLIGMYLAKQTPDIYMTVHSYADSILHSKEVMTGEKEGFVVDNLWRLRGYLWNPFMIGEGLVASLLMSVGFVIVARRLWRERSEQAYLMIFGLLIPPLFLLIADVKPYQRNLALMTPFIALFVGVGLSHIYYRLKKMQWRWIMMATFIGFQIIHISYQFDIRSGYARAAEWIGNRGGGSVLICQMGKAGPWIVNGIRDLYYVKKAHNDGRIDVISQPWERSDTLTASDQVYAGVIGYGKHCNAHDGSWVNLVDWEKPIVHFTNNETELIKKTRPLKIAKHLTTSLGLKHATKFIDNLLAEASELVDFWTVSIYAVKRPSFESSQEIVKANPDV